MQQIRFGDVICIGDAEARGFVSGDPYLTDDVFVDSVQGFDLQTVGQNQLQCFFVIEHAYEFTAAKAFQRKLRKSPLLLTEKTWRSKLDQNDPLHVELEQLLARKEDEKATNEVEAKRIAGLPVCYGSHIQLRQLSSSLFLTQSKNRAALNALALELTLAEESSKWSIWKLVPTVRIRGDGEGVHYGEEVSFASVKQRSSYLSTFVAPDLLAPVSSGEGFKLPRIHEEAKVVQPSGVTQRFEVNSSASWTKYHLLLALPHERRSVQVGVGSDQHAAVRCTDAVTICNKQHDVFLVADAAEGVRWQSRADAWFDAERPRPCGMWTIMNRTVDQGQGYLSWPSEQLVIHHLATGLALHAADPQPGCPARLQLRAAGQGATAWSLSGQGREVGRHGGVLREGDFVWLRAAGRKGRGGGFLTARRQHSAGVSPGMAEANRDCRFGAEARDGMRWAEGERSPEACLREGASGELLDMVELSVVDAAEWQMVDLVRRAAQGLEHMRRCLSLVASRQTRLDAATPSTSQLCSPSSDDRGGGSPRDWSRGDGTGREGAVGRQEGGCEGGAGEVEEVEAGAVFESSGIPETLTAMRHLSDVCFGVLYAMCDLRAALPAAGPAHALPGDMRRPWGRRGVHEEYWRGNGLGSLYHRDLLRELGVLDAAVGIVFVAVEECGVPAGETSKVDGGALQGLLARCFRLVELACKESPESKQAMAAALPLLQRALVADCGAYEAMLAVYAGTRHLLEGLHAEVFAHTVESIVKTRLPSVLSFAIEMCTCDGEPIKTNQDRWATTLFASRDMSPVFLDVHHRTGDYLLGSWVELGGKQLLLSLRSMQFEVEGTPGGEAHSSAVDVQAVVDYHCQTLELLCAMLRGGNALPRTLVAAHSKRMGLECTQLVATVSNDTLPSSVRARCVQVLQRLYVEQTPVPLPKRNSALWVWRQLQRGSGEGERRAPEQRAERLLWGGENAKEQCKTVKKEVVGKLADVAGKVGAERQHCELERSLVSLLAALFESGYYHKEENGELVVDIEQVSALGRPLLGVLDDRAFACHGRARATLGSPTHAQREGGRSLAELKVSTLKLLGRLIESCWECRTELLFGAWEAVLSGFLDCHGWPDILAATDDSTLRARTTEVQGSPGRVMGGGFASAGGHGVRRSVKRVYALADYCECPGLWVSRPPWRKSTVESLHRELFQTHPFMSELSYEHLLLIGSAGRPLPDVLKIVLFQLTFDDITLKERSLHFLFQIFQQHTTILRCVRDAKFICQPRTFEILPSLLSQVNALRSVSRVIRVSALPSRQRSNLNSRTTFTAADPEQPERDRQAQSTQTAKSSTARAKKSGSDGSLLSFASHEDASSPMAQQRLFASWERFAGPGHAGRGTPTSNPAGMLRSLSGGFGEAAPSPRPRSRAVVFWSRGIQDEAGHGSDCQGDAAVVNGNSEFPSPSFLPITRPDSASSVAPLSQPDGDEHRIDSSERGAWITAQDGEVETDGGERAGRGNGEGERRRAPYEGVRGQQDKRRRAAEEDAERAGLDDDMVRERVGGADTKGKVSSGTGDGGREMCEMARAAEEGKAILQEWHALCTATAGDGEHTIEELSQVLQVLQIDSVLLELLSSSVQPLLSGSVDGVTQGALTQLVSAGCALVATLCSSAANSKSHDFWSGHAEVLWSFVGTAAVDAESTLAVIAADNLEVLSRHGKEWIARYFRLVGAARSGHRVTARGLKFLTRLLTYKGTPMPEHNVRALAYFEDQETTMAALMKGEGEWDRRIVLMEVDELHAEEEGELALHLASVDFLAAACVGKSMMAAAVYTSHFLPFKHVMRTLLAMGRDGAGVEHDLPRHVKIRVKASFLRLLYNVFLETKVQHFLVDRHREGSGMWVVDQKDPCVKGCRPLMDSLVADLQGFRAVARQFVNDESSKSAEELRLLQHLAEYLVWALVPLVAGVFPNHGSVLVEHCKQRSEHIAERLTAELLALESDELPSCCTTVVVDRKQISVKEAARSALSALLPISHRKWKAGVISNAGSFRAVNQRKLQPEEVINAGLRAFVDSVACEVGSQEGFKSVTSVGLLQLARFFAQDGQVQLCSLSEEDANVPHSCLAECSDVVTSVLDLSKTHAVGTQVNGLLVDILQTMRAAMYLAEPAHPHLSMEDLEDHWTKCVRDAKMEKKFEPKAEMLAWVQNKYLHQPHFCRCAHWLVRRFDALGCTAAAVRLLSHECSAVQLNALRLLLALLQTGNVRVQNSVRALFSSKAGRGALQRLKGIISGGVELITGNYKRSLKTRKQSEKLRHLGHAQRDAVASEQRELSSSGQSVFGRRALLMLTLRVVQLLMEGQNAAMQNQMAKAHGGTSVFDQCIRLFLSIQPVLGDSFSSKDSELAVLCIQVIETVSECIQGPNRTSQQILLSSNFFAGVNRMLCSITYTPQAEHAEEASPTSESSSDLPLKVNDLKCWLKFSLLGCCIAVFEAVRDPSAVQGFFELVHVRNIISQISASAQVLELPLSAEQSRPSTAPGSSLSPTMFESGFGWTAPEVSQERSFFSRMRSSSEWMGSSTRHLAVSEDKRQSKAANKRVFLKIAEGWKGSFSPDSDDAMLDEILRLYILLLLFREYAVNPAHAIRIQQFQEEEPALARFLEIHTSHIECMRPSSHAAGKPLAEKVFFALRPELALLVRSKRFRMKASLEIFNVPRDNPWEKGCEFMKRIKVVHNRVHWLEVVRRSSVLDRCIAWRGRLDSAPLRLSGVITLLLLTLYGVPWDPNTDSTFGGGGFYSARGNVAGYKAKPYPYVNSTSQPGSNRTYGYVMARIDLALKYRLSLQNRWEHEDEWRSHTWARGLLYALGLLHILFTALACVLHLIIDFPLIFIGCVDANKASEAKAADFDPADNVRTGPEETRRRHAGPQFHNLPPIPQPAVSYVSWESVRVLLWRSKLTVYYAVLMCVSVLGIVSSPFFFVMFSLDVFRGSSGALVVRSLVVGGPKLVRTFLLAVVMMVCFGFMSYAYFSQAINLQQELCHSPFQCVAMHLLDSVTGDLTTVLGDDLGDFAFPGTAFWSGGWESWRTFTVALSIVAWVFLLQGIIQGQIIDAFAEMRNKEEEARDDLERKFMFQNYPGEWDKRKSGNFAWNYLLYYSHLRRKDPEEYNGMDHLAAKAFEEERADLLPVGTFVAKQREDISHRDTNLHEAVEHIKAELARLNTLTASLLANSNLRAGPDQPSPSPTARAVPRNFPGFPSADLLRTTPTTMPSWQDGPEQQSTADASIRPPLWLGSRGGAGGRQARTLAEELVDEEGWEREESEHVGQSGAAEELVGEEGADGWEWNEVLASVTETRGSEGERERESEAGEEAALASLQDRTPEGDTQGGGAGGGGSEVRAGPDRRGESGTRDAGALEVESSGGAGPRSELERGVRGASEEEEGARSNAEDDSVHISHWM